MAILTGASIQPGPGADRLRLSSAPSRLGDLYEPLALAFPSVLREGLNTTG